MADLVLQPWWITGAAATPGDAQRTETQNNTRLLTLLNVLLGNLQATPASYLSTTALASIASLGARSAGSATSLARGDHVHDVPVVATASLPAAGASQDGRMIIEDTGASLNLIVYGAGRRARLAGVVF